MLLFIVPAESDGITQGNQYLMCHAYTMDVRGKTVVTKTEKGGPFIAVLVAGLAHQIVAAERWRMCWELGGFRNVVEMSGLFRV
jgi:hypothetical protein